MNMGKWKAHHALFQECVRFCANAMARLSNPRLNTFIWSAVRYSRVLSFISSYNAFKELVFKGIEFHNFREL